MFLTLPSEEVPATCPVAMVILSGWTARLEIVKQVEREIESKLEIEREILFFHYYTNITPKTQCQDLCWIVTMTHHESS